MSEAEYMEDGADYLEEGCQRQTCDGCMADKRTGGRTMGRSIDEDELVEEIKSLKIVLDGKDIFPTAAKDTVLRIISEQPTAYDPDKVVEQLEERTAFLKDCTKYGNKAADQQSKSYDTMMMYEVMDLVDDLLEIVKAGVSDGN